MNSNPDHPSNDHDMLAYDPFAMKTSSNPSGDVARERHDLYQLLGRIFYEGLTPETLAGLQQLPQLGQTLPAVGGDPEKWSADHQQLFEQDILPNMSAFLHTHDKKPADIKAQMTRILDNYPLEPAGDSADHIEAQLQLLAFLTMLEAQAWNDDMLTMAVKARGIQRAFLQNHLLCWLPPFTIAVYRHGSAEYRTLVALLWHTVHSHFADVVNYYDLMPYFDIDFELPEQGEDDDADGIAQAIETLLSPTVSGVWVSKNDLTAMRTAAEQKLPAGDRNEQIDAILAAAEDDQKIDALIVQARELLDDWVAQYETLNRTYPATQPFVDQWLKQTRQTIERLEQK